MASLQHLNLSRNAISNVSWESLVNIPNILELDLSFNRITYVDVSVKRGSLIYLSVSHNKLETFSEENLGIVPGDPEFYRTCVEGNPLHCDCRMAWLRTLILVRENCISGYDSMSCKLYREHPLHLSLRYQNGAGFVCNSPENVRGWPISKVASLAAACEQHVYTTTTRLAKETSIVMTTSTTLHTIQAVSLVLNLVTTSTHFKNDENDSNTFEHSILSPTLLKVLCSTVIVSVIIVILLIHVVLRRKYGVKEDSLSPPPVNIPMQHIQNGLPNGDSSQGVHVYENDNDITDQDIHVYDNDSTSRDIHVYENDHSASASQDIHIYENDIEIDNT
ncbi:hypothetical protein Bbelb_404070 [Branchiostoma belcheri]|nr:hypothetical protein Bbelb_404070 [Branchiostoma belcheri]